MQPGVYRHYKGGLYTVIMTAIHADNRDNMTVYVSHTTGEVYTRPEKVFLGKVGAVNRFEFIGSSVKTSQ